MLTSSTTASAAIPTSRRLGLAMILRLQVLREIVHRLALRLEDADTAVAVLLGGRRVSDEPLRPAISPVNSSPRPTEARCSRGTEGLAATVAVHAREELLRSYKRGSR